MGITIDEILVADPVEPWLAAGFTVDDDATCRVGRARVRLIGREHGRRITGWSLREVDAEQVDGLPTTASEAAFPEPATHPNGVALIDHLVLATPDTQRTVAAFEHIGLAPRR